MVLMTILMMVLFSDCRYNRICMECTITIAGIEDVQPTFCGEKDEVDEKEVEFQEIVDRENTIVGQSATLTCTRVFE